MDVLLDISEVNFIDSSGLGSVIRTLTEIGGNANLLLCGANDRTLALLKMTHLDQTIRHETTREEALSSLFWDDGNRKQKKKNDTAMSSDPIFTSEAPTIITDLTANTHKTAVLKPKQKKKQQTKERRKFRRIDRKQITNDDIIIFCQNTSTGRHHPGMILNISPGGLLITAPSPLSIGDTMVLEGRIGKLFKFKEQAISRSSRGTKHGLEFIKLSPESSDFLTQLTGSVDMIKSNRFRYDQPN